MIANSSHKLRLANPLFGPVILYMCVHRTVQSRDDLTFTFCYLGGEISRSAIIPFST